MISQEDFDQFVVSYNTDYLFLLTRAASGSYDCLITSFRVLKGRAASADTARERRFSVEPRLRRRADG